MKMTGSEIIIECLKREGVKHVFGYPGGVVLNLFDTLYDDKDLKVILTRHEQGPSTLLTAMPVQQANPVSCWSPQVLVPPIP